jgi:hypothetical protein
LVTPDEVGSNKGVGSEVGDAWQAIRLKNNNKQAIIDSRPLGWKFNMRICIKKNRLKFAPLKFIE